MKKKETTLLRAGEACVRPYRSFPSRLAFLVCLVAVGVSQETGISGSDDNELDEFACSPGSLAKAVPALVDAETGLFTIPDTRSDLVGFFRVHQAITKAIDTALTRSQLSLTPREAAALEHPAILFGPRWRAAESGVSMTHDGKNVTLSPAYGHPSFIDGIVPVDGAAGQYYMMPSRRRCPASIQSCWRKRQARGPGRRNRTYLGSQGRTVGSP